MSVKRAHMVSKGYLLPWCDNQGHVEVLDIEQRRRVVTAVKNATVVHYAYNPSVLTHDLEGQFGKTESLGIPVLLKLRHEEMLTVSDKKRLVAFLDMHLDRGRYADQTKINTPALAIKSDGRVENIVLNLGDRLALSQSMENVLRLASHGIEEWPWKVRSVQNLATGDGAVLLWGAGSEGAVSSITFPLSPTQMLVIGQDPKLPALHNTLLEMNSRRWIIKSVEPREDA